MAAQSPLANLTPAYPYIHTFMGGVHIVSEYVAYKKAILKLQ